MAEIIFFNSWQNPYTCLLYQENRTSAAKWQALHCKNILFVAFLPWILPIILGILGIILQAIAGETVNGEVPFVKQSNPDPVNDSEKATLSICRKPCVGVCS
jgi:hypothetical protein